MSSSQGCWLTWHSEFWFKWNLFSMWFISKQIKPKKSWTVSDASHFPLEKISEAHKMSPALTIYQVTLIYGSQWTVRNGGGERWRAYNIYFFFQNCISEDLFSLFCLYTRLRHSISFSLLQEKNKKGKKMKGKKNLHICIILCSPSSKFPLPAICGCAAHPQEHAVSSEFLCLWYHRAFALKSHEWGHYKGPTDN